MLVLLPWLVAAADWQPRPESARFQRLGTAQGLSQSSVTAIAQDRRGRIWLGTQAGLNRYDGYDVTVLRPAAGVPTALSDGYITALAVDATGAVWAATLDGLNRIDPDRGHATAFHHDADDPHSVASSRLSALHIDRAGTLWIGTERGISRWRDADGRFDNWSLALGNADGLPDDRITTLASDRDGGLLVGTVRGLARFDVTTQRFTAIAPAARAGAEITALLADRDDRLWIATEGAGVQVRDGGRWQTLRGGADGLSSDAARCLLQDRDGRIWIGTDVGLDLIADPATAPLRVVHFRHHRHHADSLGGGRVSALYEGAGALWVGSWNGGVSWLSRERNRFDSFTPDQPATAGFRNPASIALLADGEQLWIGSGEGLYRFDTRGYRLTAIDGAFDPLTVFGAVASDDRYWFGTSRGVRQIERDSGQVLAPSLPDPIAGVRIRRLWVDAGRAWLAADPLGLALLDPTLQRLQELHPISRSVTFIQPLGDSLRLVGAYDGLYWFDAASGALRHVHRLASESASDDGLGAAPMAFVQAADGRLWLATNGAGLREIVLPDPRQPASAEFVPFGAAHGLGDPALKSLLQDDRGLLWLSTASGIVAFDPARERFVEFDRRDGTLGHDYINGAAVRLPDGRMVFGAMDGFTLFDPATLPLEDDAPPPAPLLTALELGTAGNGASAGALDALALDAVAHSDDQPPLRLPAGSARSFSIRFGSADFIRAEALRYQFRLHGFLSDWTEVDHTRRLASYTNLEPGPYRFEVRAAARRSGWSEPTGFDFVIEPFWWQTGWARGAALLLAALLLASVYRQRSRRAAQQRERLTRLVAERTTELEHAKEHAEQALQQLESTQQELVRSEKMAALGQLVAGVAHEVNTPIGVALTASSYVGDAATRLVGSLEAGHLRRSELDAFVDDVRQSNTMIQRNLDRAAQLIANFKQVSVDRSSDGRRRFELQPFLDELLQSLQLMWKRRELTIRIDCEQGIALDSFPGALGQVITNLMQNSVRHAFPDERAGTMMLSVRRIDAGHIELVEADDGVGIPAGHLERIWEPFFTTRRNQGGTGLGLHIVYNLVTQKLGGTIRVESTEGQGSRFIVVLPTTAPS